MSIGNKQHTVMLVDDMPPNLDLLRDLLKKNGYKIFVFPGGEMALRALQKQKPDLILLDIMMPNMDGFQFCEKLKEDENLRDIPVIFISALDDKESKLLAFRRGGVDYVSKPFHEEEVLARVSTHLKIANLQSQLKMHNEELEELVAQRTQTLQNAFEKIKILSEESYLFVRYLSHEMRTPLNWIGGGNDLFDVDDDNEWNKTSIELINKGFKRLLNLNNRFLDYSDFSRSNVQLDISPISLEATLSSVLDAMDLSLKKKNIKVIMHVPEGINIQADGNYLYQFFAIIIQNAIDFNIENGSITLSTECENDMCRLKISDTGRGILGEVLPNIFTPFKISEHYRRKDGFGLSLPKAKIIADAHGWKVWAESEGLEKGSSFYLEFTPDEA